MRPVIALGILAATACSASAAVPGSAASAPPLPAVATDSTPRARFVFFFIGDGMGASQVRAAQLFQSVVAGETRPSELSFTRFPAQGMITTHAVGAEVTDSAAAGTALASGHKTKLGVLGLLPDRRTPVESVASVVHDQGKRVGIISTVSLDHATPAAFYAHHPTRDEYGAIALQAPTSGFDYFAGGGFLASVSEPGASQAVWDSIRLHGYHLARDRAAQDALELPAFAINERLDADAAMPYEIDREPHERRLADYARQAIRLLESEAGFFIMIEGGKIDWACHANDAVTSLYETLEFSRAVEEAVAFMKRRPDETVIVVTADHETGGMALAHTEAGFGEDMGQLRQQKVSFRRFQALVVAYLVEHPRATLEDLASLLETHWGLRLGHDRPTAVVALEDEHRAPPPPAAPVLSAAEVAELRVALAVSRERVERHRLARTLHLAAGEHDEFTSVLTRTFDRRAGIHWATHYHTAAPVPVYAAGVGCERFESVEDNTDVARQLLDLMGGAR